MIKGAIIVILNSMHSSPCPRSLGCGVDPEADFPVQQTGPSPLKMDLREEGTLVLRAEEWKKTGQRYPCVAQREWNIGCCGQKERKRGRGNGGRSRH